MSKDLRIITAEDTDWCIKTKL